MRKIGLIIVVIISIFLLISNSYNSIYPFVQKEKMSKDTYLKEYLKYRRLSRADEKGNIPFDGIIKAKQHIDNMPKMRDAGLWEWEELGPGNIGGRTRAILPDPDNPDIIWIGSVSGGIWKSIDGGTSWGHIDDFMGSLAISSMVFDPSSTSIMYAATGEKFTNNDGLPGAGIFKSTDGGIHWNQLPSTNSNKFKYINRLAAHPNSDSAGIIYAITGTNSAIYKTTDGGATWIKKLDLPSTGYDIKVNPGNSAEIMTSSDSHLYLSTDYGENWIEQTHTFRGRTNLLPLNANRIEISFCPSDSNYAYVSINYYKGEIWRGKRNGNSYDWELRNNSADYLWIQGDYANTIWVSPNNKDVIVVGGLDLWRSTNGGSSLTKISEGNDFYNGGSANSAHHDQHFIVEASNYDSATNAKLYFANDGGIQKTDDIFNVSEHSGWDNLNNNLSITQFNSGAASTDGSIIVGGTQDNDKLRYKSSGNWSGSNSWYQAEIGDGGYSAINTNNPDIIFGEYIRLRIKRSTNGGSNGYWAYWSKYSDITDAGHDTTALFYAPFSMDPNNPEVLVAGGAHIWRTTNSADDWTQIRNDIGKYYNSNTYYRCTTIDIAPYFSNIIWVGYENGEVAKTTNTGVSWTKVDTNGVGLPNRWVSDIAINPNNSDQVFVTFGGYHTNNVWYTPDGGNTWENRSGTTPYDLPSLQVNTVRYSPWNSDWIYIGTDLGVFATQDRGLNWSVFTNDNGSYNGNEGPVNTEVAELFWQGDDFLIAATHGRGMFRTAGPPYKIYVDANAASGGNGTSSSPFQTIAQATQVAGPGATISIESGDYDENEIITFQNQGYIIVTNGGVVIH